MLVSMLTADHAAKHGTQFTPPFADSLSDASPSTRSPLSIFNLASWRPQYPVTPLELPPTVLSEHVLSNGAIKPAKNIMFADPEASRPLSFDQSRPTSSGSGASEDTRRKKRAPRAKTTYNLAHPPPPIRPSKKLHLRPKVYLQLQQVLPSTRPKPVYEVIPSAVFVPRHVRKFARVFKSKDKLGPSDLLIVKAEQYGLTDDEDSSDDERFSSRDVIGVICTGKKEENKPCKTEILMDDGSNWDAVPMPNGGYEFVCTDEHGLQLKCRWIARHSPSRRASSLPSPGSLEDKKFIFSTISTNSRRHPIIATMTRSSIDVFDSYTMPTTTSSHAASPVHTPLQTPSVVSDAGFFIDAEHLNAERAPIITEHTLRKLITISGIWVGFREGWSNVFSYNKAPCLTPLNTCTPASASTSKSRPVVPTRVVSMPVFDSPATPTFPDENRRTLPKLLRSSTQIINRHSVGRTPSPSGATSTTGSPTTPEPARAKRSNSTGSAFSSTRGRNSLRKRFGLTPEDLSLPESEVEREREKSMELFRNSLLQQNRQTNPVQPPPIRIAQATPQHTPTPSPRRSTSKRVKANSVDYSAGTTAGLWDTGDRDRPTSMFIDGEVNGKGGRRPKRSGGRLRRMFGIFKKNHSA
ncbi:uncharacterized protein BDZ99DRAFT_461191 [Mytilinidion resinicola]|uniref:Uncharacterized protein n=1 Tax=Mytilinidion resinicola TaxID=574789 RepID=A0A6A6YVE2_9PEZI|nr:uncharacterized protein BDZ99DRAFT_461191 [Mytilinidion resinicola]KAF2812518.1 hypothetical protein BDZ99DRAFT_461191 [Mytilinidion resinicola]